MACGDDVSDSTLGLPDLRGSSSGDQLHQFCPSTNGTAQVDTCQSSFDTMLFINGPDVNLDCDDACEGFEGCPGYRENVKFDFMAGKCYDIIVSGYGSDEGDYVLSIDCGDRVSAIEVECGSTVSRSTVGLVGGAQPHLFCPNETGRVEASTCGSSFNTEIQLNGLNGYIPDFECGACPTDPNAKCVGFNARCGFFVT